MLSIRQIASSKKVMIGFISGLLLLLAYPLVFAANPPIPDIGTASISSVAAASSVAPASSAVQGI